MGGEQLVQRPEDGHKLDVFPEMKGHCVREGTAERQFREVARGLPGRPRMLL